MAWSKYRNLTNIRKYGLAYRLRLSRVKQGPPNPYPGVKYFAPILES